MPDLSRLLMPHQLEVIDKLDSGKILYGATGDGKTRAVAGYYVAKELPAWPRDIYVITTAKKRDLLDWEGEFAYFGIGSDPGEESLGGILTVDSWNNISRYAGYKDEAGNKIEPITDAFFISMSKGWSAVERGSKRFSRSPSRSETTDGSCYRPLPATPGWTISLCSWQMDTMPTAPSSNASM
jgi:hypothetical protein